MTIQELFDKTIAANASDLHFVVGEQPKVRVDGTLLSIPGYEFLTKADVEGLIFSILTPEQKELFLNNRALDFSYGYGGGDYGERGRFRINIYHQRGTVALAARLLPPKVKSIEDLLLPQICHTFAKLKQGFVLVTGPTGHGKSTTIASIINEINMTIPANIITIEDPIEYVYPRGQAIISQREIGSDSIAWAEALRSALREDPDVILIGEMRDPESISSAITMAETGHLVFSTLHTNSASQTIDRIIDSFPGKQQNQIKAQLAGSLGGIISQRLIPKITGGRIVACEIMIANNAIRSNIREGKTHLIDSTIETAQDIGMLPLESSLATLVKEGAITLDAAKSYVVRQESFAQLIS